MRRLTIAAAAVAGAGLVAATLPVVTATGFSVGQADLAADCLNAQTAQVLLVSDPTWSAGQFWVDTVRVRITDPTNPIVCDGVTVHLAPIDAAGQRLTLAIDTITQPGDSIDQGIPLPTPVPADAVTRYAISLLGRAGATPTAPAAPTNVTVSVAPDGTATITWTGVPDATSYVVTATTPTGTPVADTTVPADQPTATTLTVPNPNTRYVYTVTAVGPTGSTPSAATDPWASWFARYDMNFTTVALTSDGGMPYTVTARPQLLASEDSRFIGPFNSDSAAAVRIDGYESAYLIVTATDHGASISANDPTLTDIINQRYIDYGYPSFYGVQQTGPLTPAAYPTAWVYVMPLDGNYTLQRVGSLTAR